MLVDSHCHLNFLDLSLHDNHLDTVINNAKANDVQYMLCVATNLPQLPEVLKTAQTYKNVYASVGVHPNDNVDDIITSSQLIKLAADTKVVAIGETGLDYYRQDQAQNDMTWQQERFRQHIQAAKETKKPLIIHARAAKEDTLSIMQAEKAGQVGGVMHCFTEDWDMAKRAIELGFYISFSGIVTFKNAQQVQEVAKKVPWERMLIETDAPYLAPIPYRGKENQPAYVRHVAEFIAELRGEKLETVAQHTTNNFFKLFKINIKKEEFLVRSRH